MAVFTDVYEYYSILHHGQLIACVRGVAEIQTQVSHHSTPAATWE
jgi:hypothetical protein